MTKLASRPAAPAAAAWWCRSDLGYHGESLHFGGADLARLAAVHGTPLYVYSGERALENLARLTTSLAGAGVRHRVFYAMKSNRNPSLLSALRASGRCGVDVCSPGELHLALAAGFAESDINYTGTCVSNRDLDVLAAHPGVWVNCDALSTIRRLAERAPRPAIGLRINPGVGLGYRQNELLRYSGARPTKFGIYASAFEEALALAKRCGMRVEALHVHAGCGFLTPQLAVVEELFATVREFVARVPAIRHVNLGGGLGIPLTADDAPLDIDAWAALVARSFGDTDLEIRVEPGDYIAKDAGVLVLEVNTIERKEGVTFVGVDGGFNIHIEPAFYGLPLEAVPVARPADDDTPQRVTIAGNINEALDIFAHDALLPPMAEGELLAFLNAGGYGAAMSSNHCARGRFAEIFI